MVFAVPFGLAIGLALGSVGGGGAILALPVLVYVLGEPIGPAVTGSLIVVALAAAIGASSLAVQGSVCWRLALTFSAPAAVGAVAGTMASVAVSPTLLIVGFVPVMLAAAGASWHRAGSPRAEGGEHCPEARPARVVAGGLGVGALTGFFGVGGGFVIVPLLAVWLGMSFRRAVATSLAIIALTGLVALTGHLAAGASLDVPVTAALAASTVVGTLCGARLARRLPQRVLGRAFSLVVAMVAVLVAGMLALGTPPIA